jgi:hypothetical protein
MASALCESAASARFCLDRDDPSKVMGRLSEPQLQPTPDEWEGYMPHAVFSWGALLPNGELIIPCGLAGPVTGFATRAPRLVSAAECALAGHATGFATVPVSAVLAAMRPEAG